MRAHTPQQGDLLGHAQSKSIVRRRSGKTILPEDWQIGPDGLVLALREGLTEEQALRAARKFMLHARKTKRFSADWDAEWESWVLGDVERLQQRGGGRIGAMPQFADAMAAMASPDIEAVASIMRGR
jgi:hypothetical protein